jgi:beta-L-N-acetylhexosaminidase
MAALAENAWVKDRGPYSAFLPRLTRLKSLYDVYNLHYANHVWKK